MKKLYKSLLLTFIFVVSVTELGIAQTITIGSGNTSNGITTASPVNIYYRRQVSQMVYTKAELNAAGVTGPATINKLGFFVSNKPVYNIPGYTVSIKHTTATNAAGNLNGGYSTIVNSHTFAGVTGQWNLMDANTPFVWNGVNNIAIQVCWSQVAPTYDPSGQVRTMVATSGYRYRVDDNGGSICGSNPNNVLNTKPQIRFVFATETVWTGTINSNWQNPLNWTANVPDKVMDARIPAGTPNNPTVSGTAVCRRLQVDGAINFNSSSKLAVHGDLINNGTVNDNGGETTFSGTGSNILTNNSTLQFSTLNCKSKGGVTMNGNPIIIKTSLGVQKSTLNTNGLVTIRSNATATGRIDELITNCFYSITMTDSWGDGWNGGFLEVFEDGVSIGTYSATDASDTETLSLGSGSTINFVYTAGTFENENAYTIFNPSGSPIFSDGTNPSTGTVFTTVPSCGFTDPITGAITMERYIDAGETYWRYFGSAVQGATFQQFEDDFVTAGYPGSAFPNFPFISAYTYNEAMGAGQGYVACTGTSQVIGVGQGLQIWCGDTITGTQPFTFDLTGVPNQGDINLPVTYTNFGIAAEDGFNQVSNPYPSTINWDSPDWTKTNMANATYIQNPDNQQYATYVAGASTNGGSRYIASQQSFWVKAFAASPVLTAREKVKSATDQSFFKAQTPYSPGLKITLQGNQEFDEAILRHIDGAVDAFEYAYDADKWWGGWGQYPQVSLINGENKDLTVHSFDKNSQEWSIPLRAIVFQDGMYNLKFNNISELNVPCLQLEDTYTGTTYLIQEGTVLSFQMDDSTYAPRFIMHLGRNYDVTATAASCFGNNDGEIVLDLDEPNPVDYVLNYNSTSSNGNALGDPLVISGLVSGIYSIEVPTLTNLCAQTTFNVVVNQPAPLTINETIVDEMFGNDGSVSIVIAGSGTYSYLWNNGQTGNSITNLGAGNYNVLITDMNGCESSETYFVNSQLSIDELGSEIEMFYKSDQNAVVINGYIDPNNADFNLYSSEGKLFYTYQLSSVLESQTLSLPAGLASGIYIIGNGNVSLKFKK